MPRTAACRSRACSRPRDRLCARGLPGHRAARPLDRGDGAPARGGCRDPPRSSCPSGGRRARAQTLRNPDLARTLEAIGAAGRGEFYEGEVAAEIARWSRERGGLVTAADFRAQRAQWGAPLSAVYRDVTLFETPPPTQGLSRAPDAPPRSRGSTCGALDYLGPDHVHLLIQAKQLAFHDRDRFLADPRFVEVPVARLLSDAYIAERRRLIDPARALALGPGARRGEPGRRHRLRRGGRRGRQRRLASS